jgi:phosphoglycolate phosphatase-like HAD superfamily hydrolase
VAVVAAAVRALAVDLDGALGDTRPLWDAWLAEATRVVDLAGLPDDRAAAVEELDRRGGNWRVLLARFAEDHAPVHLRPNAEAAAALRRLAGAGVRIGVFTDAPAELASVALAHLGAARRIELVETGAGALDRVRSKLGADAALASTRTELVTAASARN